MLEEDQRVLAVISPSERRLEVNLDLGQHRGDQAETVERFLGVRNVFWRGMIQKDIEVFYYPDCEVVYYTARAGQREIRCVEFESLGESDLDDAREILRRYERITGFGDSVRETRSLVELMFAEVGEWVARSMPPADRI